MLTILNDLHLATNRIAGTTPASRQALRAYCLERFESLLPESDLLINGDLLDTASIPLSDLLDTYRILSKWLIKGYKLYNSRGNHCAAKSTDVISSYDLLCSLLDQHFPSQHVTINTSAMTPYGYVIASVANQTLFDAELAKVPSCDFLFIHANVMNHFAAMSDNSLNISAEQIAACPAKQIICAHEHAHRVVGKVLIPGNQFATSVSDWQSPHDKFYTVINEGVAKLVYSSMRGADYLEVDWKDLEVTNHKFVKVVGEASAVEAADLITKLNKVRGASNAFVITNAVKILSDEGLSEGIDLSMSESKAFNLKEILYPLLNSEEVTTLESLK